MKPVELVPRWLTLRGCAASPRGGLRGAPELDTYKQTLQPNNDAASGPIEASKMRPFVGVLRTGLYAPLRALQALQVHPSHYLGLIAFLVRLDAPLRGYLRGANAKR
jgi:hypothetical protein